MSRQKALEVFGAALEAVQPAFFLPKIATLNSEYLKFVDWRIPLNTLNKIFIAGAGKAAAAMAREMELILGDRIAAGVIVTKYGHTLPLNHIISYEAGHPVPDENGVEATRKFIGLLQLAGKKDIIILLVSGGASALLVDHPPTSSLDEVQILNQLLLGCGATIHEINTVRKHVSLIKGGQLLRYINGSGLVSLIISDVPGDDLSVIASGLTVPDPSTFHDAWKILEKYEIVNQCPRGILKWIQDGIAKKIHETPKAGDPLFGNTHNSLVASNRQALEAAKQKAELMGFQTTILNDQLQGEARDKAREFVQTLIEYKGQPPACFLMGGETTVTIRGKGKGGRNQEFALAALCEMIKTETENITILSGGTDGTDGPTDATGAYADKEISIKTKEMGLNPFEFLDNNDAYSFFSQAGGLIKTGPTQTNVMDLVIGIIQ